MFTKEEYQIQYLDGVDLIYHKRQIYAPEVYVDVHTFGIISISINPYESRTMNDSYPAN